MALEPMLARVPTATRVWIDETYVDYAGSSESLERFAVSRPNVVISKSLSKAFALSGLRAAYACAATDVLAPLRRLTPPWAVSLPAQVAAVKALEDAPYYEARWRETAALREALARDIATRLRAEVVPSATNFVLFHLPDDAPTAAIVVTRTRDDGLYVRDASDIGSGLGPRALRVAVKDARTNAWMVDRLVAAVARG
jgi:histidinol-phosphate/aromatic aminotransferase/cobyric acid decarboxylase-like protein